MTGSNARGHIAAARHRRRPRAARVRRPARARDRARGRARARVGARLAPVRRRVPGRPSAARRVSSSAAEDGRSRPALRVACVTVLRSGHRGAARDCERPPPPVARGRALRRDRDDGRRSRVAVQWHAPLEEVVRRRVRFILDHQRASHRARRGRRRAACRIDTEHGSPCGAGWADFSDARERLGMGLLLQEALRHGYADDLARPRPRSRGYRRFVAECVLSPTTSARRCSHRPRREPRLYDVPWLAPAARRARPRTGARSVLRGFYAAAGSASWRSAPGSRRASSSTHCAPRARRRRYEVVERLLRDTRAALGRGSAASCPPHEVNYEQSMVAPLLESSARPAPERSGRERRTRRVACAPAVAARVRRPPAARAPARHRLSATGRPRRPPRARARPRRTPASSRLKRVGRSIIGRWPGVLEHLPPRVVADQLARTRARRRAGRACRCGPRRPASAPRSARAGRGSRRRAAPPCAGTKPRRAGAAGELEGERRARASPG